MALQTETLSTSTSAATSSSSSSSTTTDDNPDTGSFFTPTSSPPLILAFLAIGLLATAIIAALGWRHAYFSRFRPAVGRQMHRGQAQKAQMDIGSKPKLWDLWTTSDAGAISRELAKRPRMNSGTKKVSILNADQDIKWETIMPISVTPLIRESDDERSQVAPGLPSERISLVPHIIFQSRYLLGSVFHYLRYRIRQQEHEDSAAMGPAERPETEKDSGITCESDVRNDYDQYEGFQIAVAIAMPMPKDGGIDLEPDGRRPEINEYSVGLLRVPWSGRTPCHDV